VTGHERGGFNSLSEDSKMTCYGKVITVWYSEATGLPCLFTAGGVTSYLGYI